MSVEVVSSVTAELGTKYLYLKYCIADGCRLSVYHFLHFSESLSSHLLFPPRKALRDEDELVNLWELSEVKSQTAGQ